MPTSPPSSSDFRILSIDGGGIRGAFAAAFLAKLEEQIGQPIGTYFDLIAGTSTGAIIAAGLAFNNRASVIKDFYSSVGSQIFNKSWFNLGIFKSKYEQNKLKRALVDVFGNQCLKDASCRLLIPAINISGGQTVVFKTAHLPNMIRDPQRQIVDVLLAATAAPYFFPQARLNDGIYIDGGLWANNPSMVAYSEAIKIHESCKPPQLEQPFEVNDIRLLSIGTGKPKYFMKPKYNDSGFLWWGKKFGQQLLNVIGASQSQGYHFQSQYILGQNYTRINFDIPDGNWCLDATEHTEDLMNYGNQTACEFYGSLKDVYFAAQAPQFHPYS